MESHTKQAIVLSGGEPIAINPEIDLPDDAYVIAADSGLHHAERLGLAVDLVVGDMDSVDAAVLDEAVRNGSAIQRHPTDKDHTDLELAIDAALGLGTERILVVGSHAGRLDHLLGSMGLLAATAETVRPRRRRCKVRVWTPCPGTGSPSYRPEATSLVSQLKASGGASNERPSQLVQLGESAT